MDFLVHLFKTLRPESEVRDYGGGYIIGREVLINKTRSITSSKIFHNINRRTKGQTDLGSSRWHEEFHNSANGDETGSRPKASQIADGGGQRKNRWARFSGAAWHRGHDQESEDDLAVEIGPSV